METIAPINLEYNSNKSESQQDEPEQPSSLKGNENRIYACRNNCDATFESFKLLNRHIYTEHREVIANKVSKCRYCDVRVMKKLMLRHLKTEHTECKYEGCDVRLQFLAIKVHMSQEHGDGKTQKKKKHKKEKKQDKVYECRVNDCKWKFQTRTDQREHVNNDHTEEEQMRPCAFAACKQSFGPLAMKEHISNVHGNDFEKKCGICNLICTTKPGWEKHNKMHARAIFNQQVQRNGTLDTDRQGVESISRKIDCVLGECEEQIKKKEMNEHLIKFHGLKFSCYLCKKSLKSKTHAEVHFKKHMIQPIIGPKCKHCGMKFSDKKSWRAHKHTAHSKTLQCKVCGKKFHTRKPYRDHMKGKHAADKNQNGTIPDVTLD